MNNTKKETLAERIYNILIENGKPLSISEISEEINDKPTSTIRGRIYDNIGRIFKKIARGIYWVENEESACVVIEADGRKEGLQLIDDAQIDALICDHPYDFAKQHKGGNRDFTSDYDCFRYTAEDFKEKARVLKDGGFAIEFLPSESAENFEYLHEIKMNAKKAGLQYYATTLWKKGDFVANTGRVSKQFEQITLFYKGKRPRALRPDKKKILQGFEDAKMAGTTYMLPAYFDYAPPTKKERIHQAEKPVDLITKLIEAITLPGEIIVDQYAGSGVIGASVLKLKNRIGILFEVLKENVDKIATRLNAKAIYKEEVAEMIKTTVTPTICKIDNFGIPESTNIGQLELF